ncbi:pectate lyase D 3 [Phlyctema vagabunda]|uniref:Pectate lyase n=1 Tax=Phlyctema vagabunda TaxID=108571 RepID=A0ABR4PBA7_9HELO
MKFTMAQMAVLALALGVTAAPTADGSSGLVVRQKAPRAWFDMFSAHQASKDDDDDDESAASSTVDSDSKTSTKLTKTATSAQSTKTSSSSDDDEDSSATTSSSQATKTSSSGSTKSSAAATITSSASSGSSGSSSGSLPASSGTSALSAAQTIAAGESFDGGMVMFDRGVECTGQSEGGESDAVFQIEEGGSLSNVIIGPNQIEGVHCQGACTLTNVWWSAVCEDAFSIKKQEAGATTYIKGGGAFGASDKVVQHNGAGTVSISDFTVDTFGKLYRSCGNCDSMYERHVIMDGITATDGSEIAGINYNYGDTATLSNIVASGVDDICVEYTGTDDNDEEPTEYASGPDGKYCIYSESDVTSS